MTGEHHSYITFKVFPLFYVHCPVVIDCHPLLPFRYGLASSVWTENAALALETAISIKSGKFILAYLMKYTLYVRVVLLLS